MLLLGRGAFCAARGSSGAALMLQLGRLHAPSRRHGAHGHVVEKQRRKGKPDGVCVCVSVSATSGGRD